MDVPFAMIVLPSTTMSAGSFPNVMSRPLPPQLVEMS